MTPDVNVLVAAARSDHPHHTVARGWLAETLVRAESNAACTLMPMVAVDQLRNCRRCATFTPWSGKRRDLRRLAQRPQPVTMAVFRFVNDSLSVPRRAHGPSETTTRGSFRYFRMRIK